MAGKCALSDWEMSELAYYHRRGWTTRELASHYGFSERTVRRYLRREALRADSRLARTEME